MPCLASALMDHDQIAEIAESHAEPSWLENLLYRRNPTFESARQFARFINLVWEHWEGPPGLGSSAGITLEMERLGCRVQTSPDYSAIETGHAVYHTGWILRVLRATNASLVQRHTRQQLDKLGAKVVMPRRRSAAKRDGIRLGNQHFLIWTNCDVFGVKQTEIARDTETSDSTVSRRLSSARLVVEEELEREGKLRT